MCAFWNNTNAPISFLITKCVPFKMGVKNCVIRTMFLSSFFYILLNIPIVKSLTYSDLVQLNASCDEMDSCEWVRNSRMSVDLDWKKRNCFCDDMCSYYGDCCINAENYNKFEQNISTRPQKCINLRNFDGVYMQTKCSSNWKGDDKFQKLCESASPDSYASRPDPFLSTPVTSLETMYTYANFYCAVCNNDTRDTVSWQTRVECPTLENESDEVREQLNDESTLMNLMSYKDSYWGITLNDTRHECFIDPFVPETLSGAIRHCQDSISTCPRTYNNTEIIELCNSYTAVVYYRGIAYRNFHCAKCNNLTSDNISCFNKPDTRLRVIIDNFNDASFSLLLDFSDSTNSNIVGQQCSNHQIWDPFFKKCRVVFCLNEEDTFRNGKCFGIEDEDFNLDNSTFEPVTMNYEIEDDVNKNSTHKSQRIIVFPGEVESKGSYIILNNNATENSPTKSPLNCNRVLLPENEFEFKEDNNVLISKYQKILTIDEYELHEGGILVCLLETSNQKFTNIMGWVTIAGLGISFICLSLHLIAFVLVAELRNLSGKNLASLCLALLGAYTSFILGIFGEEGKLECIILGSLAYYFFLASFCWMNVMAFDVWRTLRLAQNELRVSGGDQWKKFIVYCIYGWLLPGAALATLLLIDVLKPANIPQSYLPQMGHRICWFGQRKALLVYFATPLVFIMTTNIFFFIMTAKMIASSTQSTAKFSSCRPQQSHFKLYMRLALLMGLAWIIGIMAGYLQEEYLWYVFIIFNTLQGAFIFAAFTCKKNVLRALCCSKALEKRLITPNMSSRRHLESRDSNNSQFSQSSDSNLTTNSLSRSSS